MKKIKYFLEKQIIILDGKGRESHRRVVQSYEIYKKDFLGILFMKKILKSMKQIKNLEEALNIEIKKIKK